MEYVARGEPQSRPLTLPLQLLVASILVPIESFVAWVIAQIICEVCFKVSNDLHPQVRQDDVFVLVTMLVILAGIWSLKGKRLLDEWIIGVISALVPVLLCLKIWG